MQKTTFNIPKMDCPSEESMIRTKLDGIKGIKKLDFDIPGRTLVVFHDGEEEKIEESIISLKLGGIKEGSEITGDVVSEDPGLQRKILWTVLGINFVFFIIEILFGLLSRSINFPKN